MHSSATAAVAFIGIGNMGSPMSQHLAKQGFALTVYDLDPERSARFAREHGCAAARTLAELAGADVVVTMLPTGRDVRAVLTTQDGGLARHLRSGTLIIDMSSSEPVGTRELGAELAALGLRLIDAPVSGAVPRAQAGTLTIMVGAADAHLIERARPVLEAMGDRLISTGALGSGHAMKALNNFVAASSYAAAAEALLIGKRFGLDPSTMLEVLNTSTGRNFITEMVMKEHVIGQRYATGFAVGLLAKDVKIAADLGTAVGLDAPLTRLVSERWALARDRLGPQRDNTEAILAWDQD